MRTKNRVPACTTPLMPRNDRLIETSRAISLIFNIGCVIVINLAFFILTLQPEMARVNVSYLREMWVLVNVSAIPALAMGSMRRHEQRAMLLDKVVKSTLVAVVIHALFLLALTTFLHLDDMRIRDYIFFYALMLVGLLVFRVAAAYALKEYRRHGYNYTRVVIVGAGPNGERLASSLRKDSGFGYKILGFFDDSSDEISVRGDVYPIAALRKFVVDNDVRQIFYTLSGQNDVLADVIRIADDNCIEFYYVPQIPRTLARNFELNNVGHLPLLSIRHNPLKKSLNRLLKRSFDLTVSSLFLCFYPIVYIIVAIGIKMGSPGPVYFRQERTGYLGRSFECLKFRTMKVNSTSDVCQATKNDPRKTRFGEFLRRTSIDELPQFINVWRGEMSIVGPRPHMLMHTEQYTELIDRYMLRHAVKPGITGWAQVNGYRGPTDELWKMERRVEYDVWYIENWSLLLDMKIIVRTVINAFRSDENAF